MLKYKIPQIVTLTRFYVDPLTPRFQTGPKMFQLCFSTKRGNSCKLLIYKNFLFSYPDPGSNRDGSESTGV